jgi:hypothetical protein
MGNVNDFINTANSANTKFGPADVVVLSGHGTRDGIALGNESDLKGDEAENASAVLHPDNLSRNSSRLRNGYIKSGGTIVLNSCTTGETNIVEGQASLAANLSSIIGHGVFVSAPNIESVYYELNLQVLNNGNLSASPFSLGETANRFSTKRKPNEDPYQNQQRTYQNGALLRGKRPSEFQGPHLYENQLLPTEKTVHDVKTYLINVGTPTPKRYADGYPPRPFTPEELKALTPEQKQDILNFYQNDNEITNPKEAMKFFEEYIRPYLIS